MPRNNTEPPLHLQTTAPIGAKQLGLAEAAAPGQCQHRAAPYSPAPRIPAPRIPALPAAPALPLDLPLLPGSGGSSLLSSSFSLVWEGRLCPW